MEAKTSVGNSLTCGMGSKTSLKSDFIFLLSFERVSVFARISMCAPIALATQLPQDAAYDF